MEAIRTVQARIAGVVQGVGFRPYLHKLAQRFALGGWVKNTTEGVELAFSGPQSQVDAALREIREHPPALARIEAMELTALDVPPYAGFHIYKSERRLQKEVLVAPDSGLCADCLRELFDPGDRRYRYPFINCTNCGPRFTILRDVPYDRPNTTMAAFPMCAACAAEYGDVTSRRYHAQPDCCAACGPRLCYLDANGKAAAGDALMLAQEALKAGKIVAVKGLGGFHLACLPEADPVARLRALKGRDERPLALMCRDTEAVRALCALSAEEEAILASPARPILLLEGRVSLPFISENRRLGVMLPYTPLHALLLEPFSALVMTSANRSEEPMLYTNEAAVQTLAADGFLLHDRDIETRCDDSLAFVVSGAPYFVRRSRGYVPEPLPMQTALPPLLACGAEQKASFAFSKGKHVFLSQHIGDVKNLATYAFYEQEIHHLTRLFDADPAALVCDLHPDYLSTEYASERCRMAELPLLRVQHHEAHMASCMADNDLTGPCLGLVWDGSGYGTDGTVWGGEGFVCGGDLAGDTAFARRASLLPIPLLGGDAAVKEIARLRAALLWSAGLDAPGSDEPYRALYAQSPRASSVGRLFDGIYALVSGRETVSYEGQGATLLEAMAARDDGAFEAPLIEENGLWRMDWRPLVRGVVSGMRSGIPPDVLAARFMNTLCELGCAACLTMRAESGISRVVLSGGVFQNLYLLARMENRLAQAGFTVYHHHRVSCNDEGIALGQLVIGAARYAKTENKE